MGGVAGGGSKTAQGANPSLPPALLRAVSVPGCAPAPRRGAQERVEVWNSPLNEGATLAFEYGFSLGAAGRALVLWEAQFGDFANNAQAVVDLFVAAAEERWNQQSGLVLLLPHGKERRNEGETESVCVLIDPNP